MNRFIASLLLALVISFSGVAQAASLPYYMTADGSRTFAHIYTEGEFHVVPNANAVGKANMLLAMTTQVQNWITTRWISPGIVFSSDTAPGNAFVFGGDGIVQGVYIGIHREVGKYVHPFFGIIDVVDGDFRPALEPSTGPMNQPGAYVKMPVGVTKITADTIAFEGEGKPAYRVYDLRKGYVVSITPGTGRIVGHCSTYKDVLDAGYRPELAAIGEGSCE